MSQSRKPQGKVNINASASRSPRRELELKKMIVISILVLAFVIIAIVLVTNIFGDNAKSGGKKTSVDKDSNLVIQKSEISEKVKFYPVEVDGTKLEVLAVKASDNTIRTAFNTCQVCYSSGRGYYIQEGNALVCQNCGNRFGMNDVEVTRGGCNPVPIEEGDKTVTDTDITISKDFLTKAKVIFANWKN